MERSKIRITVLMVLLLVAWVYSDLRAETVKPDQVLARVGSISINAYGLRRYAMARSDLAPFLGTEAGAKKIAQTWVQEEVLLLYALEKEGKDPFKAAQSLKPAEALKKIVKLLKDEFPPLPPVTDDEALQAYQKHPENYAIPTRVHIKKMSFALSGEAGRTPKEKAWEIMRQAKKDLDSGSSFEDAFKKAKSHVPDLNSWDFGFIPLDGSFEGQSLVSSLSEGESRLWQNNEGLFLLYVNRKKPGRIEPFENIKELIKKDVSKRRDHDRKARLIERLEKKYNASILF